MLQVDDCNVHVLGSFDSRQTVVIVDGGSNSFSYFFTLLLTFIIVWRNLKQYSALLASHSVVYRKVGFIVTVLMKCFY